MGYRDGPEIQESRVGVVGLKGTTRAHLASLSGIDLFEEATLLLLLDLQEQRTVDAGQDTTEGDGCADESIQFLITTDGELQVAGRDTLDLQILGGVAGQFQDFSSEVLEHSGHVDGS